MRDRTKEELAALCFSACKLNLPLVPSQDGVLKDNKRCYDNILSECGITDPLQIYSGWLDKVGKAYEYFSSGWLQEGYFLKAKSNNNNLCILRTKCSPSQTYHIAPKKMMV